MLVSEIIVRERKIRGMSLAELGEQIGVDKTTASRYENGKVKMIPLDVLHKIAELFDYNFDELIAGDPNYCMFVSKSYSPDINSSNLSSEDQQLLAWFHSLPEEVKKVVKQFWTIPIKV